MDRITDAMKGAAAFCLAAMAALTLCDVFGRSMGTPIFGSEELVSFLAVGVIALSLPYAHREKSHIGVEILMRLFSRRTRWRIRLATNCAATVLFSLVTWRLVVYGLTLRDSGVLSMNLELPEYFVVFIAAVGFLAFTLRILGDVVRDLRSGEE